MKKFSFIFLFFFGLAFFSQREEKQPVKKMVPVRTMASLKTPKAPPVPNAIVDAVRDTSEDRTQITLPPFQNQDLPRRTPSGERHSLLPEGFLLSQDVHVVKESDYTPSLGEVMQRHGGLVFVKSTAPVDQELGPVVVDPSGRYLLVKPVVKLSGIDDEKRAELLRDGVSEHYYAKGLKLMYVESTPSTVLADAQKMKSEGYSISLELHQGTHRLR